MSDTNTSTGMPALLSADELYDTLMGQIEPDLILQNLSNTMLALQNDTEKQRTERAARYDAAFAEYDRKLTEHKKAWDRAYTAYHKSACAGLDAFIQAADDAHLLEIEKSIDSSSAQK